MPRKTPKCILRADALLGRSGQWGRGVDEKRVKDLAAQIKDDCLGGIFTKTNTHLVLARLLASIEIGEKFNCEWLKVKKLLRGRRDKLRNVKRVHAGKALNDEIREIDKYLIWMKQAPWTQAGASNAGTKPFLHQRWGSLRQMEQHLINDYQRAYFPGLSPRLDELAWERHETGGIPKWASMEDLRLHLNREMGRNKRAKILADIMALSPVTKMSTSAILKGLQRYFPAENPS